MKDRIVGLVRNSLLLCLVGCGSSRVGSRATPARAPHSSSIAISSDGATVYVVNPDSDSVSFLDAKGQKLVREVFLTGAAPVQDPATQRFEPAATPRALALSPDGKMLYVTGQRSGSVYTLDTSTGALVRSAPVCSEPVGVLPSKDGATLYVACSEDAAVYSLVASSLSVAGRVSVDAKPWSLAWSGDGAQLYVTHLLGPGVTVVDPARLTVASTWPLTDGPSTGDSLEPHGPVRGIYDVLPRPGSDEVWTVHVMLGIDTRQPDLVFNNTTFPAASIFDSSGNAGARLSVGVHPGDNGAFGDVVSGPHAIEFTPDGAFAFIADTNSDDVLVVDARQRVEATLVRPLPGHGPEGVAVSGDGHVYVDERNTSDVAVLDYTVTPGTIEVTVSGTIGRVSSDPMPPSLRFGQHLFYSANSSELPITQDSWVACASCHIEGRSDAVTWLFLEGPRDTPSNAGGVLNTGFLLRTAARRTVQDYWQTINAEQGGHFSDPAGATAVPALSNALDALAAYVNYAIPYPTAPSMLDANLVAQGSVVFQAQGCGSCHSGPYFTDSGRGNSGLLLSGPVTEVALDGGVLLHDMTGLTCVTSGPTPDTAVADEEGNARTACSFDTPTLRGIADTAPYFHDGSAKTIADAVGVMLTGAPISADDRVALVEYLRSL